MDKSKYSLGCSAKSSSKIEKSCHILPIVAWPWGGQSDLFRYYSSRDEVLLYESLTTGGKPSTWLPPGGCRADTWIEKKILGGKCFFTKNKANIKRQNIERKQEGEKETNKQRKKDKGDNEGN